MTLLGYFIGEESGVRKKEEERRINSVGVLIQKLILKIKGLNLI